MEHEAAIKYARAEISNRWKQEGFREESKAVNQKLGSRNRSPSRKKQTQKKQVKQKDTPQLSLDL